MTSSPAKPLTVLHLTMGAVLGGVTRYICDLSKGLRAVGHASLAGGAAGPWEELFRQEQVEWVHLDLDGGIGSLWRSAAKIRDLVRGRNVDLIHCHFRRPLVACRLARLRGMAHVPVVFTLHLAPIPIGGVAHRFAGFGDLTIVPAQEAQNWVTRVARVPESRVVLVPHGIDLERWRPPTPEQRLIARKQIGMDARSALVAFVGRFEHPKNEQWVLDLAAECRTRQMNVGFVMCGDGPNAGTVHSRVKQEGLTEIVNVKGYSDPLPIYHAADLVVVPSAIEGFGYVVAEAAACGVAVIRTKTAGWQETVIDGETGVAVPIERQAFIEACLEQLANPERLKGMGQNAAALALQRFPIDKQVQATLEVYQQILPTA